MTAAAMEENRSGKKKRPATDFFPEDYVGIQTVKGLIGITLVYGLIVGAWFVCTADVWLSTYSYGDLLDLAKRFLILYAVVMVVSAIILVLVYSLRYYQAKSMAREEENKLRKVCRFYEK